MLCIRFEDSVTFGNMANKVQKTTIAVFIASRLVNIVRIWKNSFMMLRFDFGQKLMKIGWVIVMSFLCCDVFHHSFGIWNFFIGDENISIVIGDKHTRARTCLGDERMFDFDFLSNLLMLLLLMLLLYTFTSILCSRTLFWPMVYPQSQVTKWSSEK